MNNDELIKRAEENNMDEMEHWKQIEEFTDYEVSNHGRVRRTRSLSGTHFMNTFPSTNRMFYPRVRLTMMPKRKIYTVHQLVARAFIPNPEGKPCINHIDCNPANNHFSNLEWCTQGENVSHSRKLGRYPDNYWKGKRGATASLSDDTVLEIRSLRLSGMSYQRIADLKSTNKKSVMNVCLGRTYRFMPLPQSPRGGWVRNGELPVNAKTTNQQPNEEHPHD